MRKYNICIKTALAVFAIALSACSSDNDVVDNNSTNPETPVSEKTMSFSAIMDAENTTRTDFNNNSTIWTGSDAIKIANVATITAADQESYPQGGVFNIVTHEGTAYTKEEVFTGSKIQSNGNNQDEFYAIYPSSTSGPKLNFQDKNAVKMKEGNVPAKQTAVKGAYDQSLHFMTAFSNNSTFAFKNVCALIKITLKNYANISRIKVVANPTINSSTQQFDYTYIAGDFDAVINPTDGTTTSTKDNITTSTVTITNNTNRSTYVYLQLPVADDNCEEGTFYMVVLPATISNGFTLLLEASDGNTIYQRVNTSITKFERNKMYNLGTYDFSSTPTDLTALSNVVDLGLPSGTLWATKNIAAGNNLFVTNEYDYGQYYCWAEDFGFDETPTTGTNTESAYTSTTVGVWPLNTTYNTKIKYEWETYKWQNGTTDPGSTRPLGKYNPTDGNKILDPWVSASNKGDDIAQIKSQGKYRIPTPVQFAELGNDSYISITNRAAHSSNSNSSGYKITSKMVGYTNKTMWLPAAGICYGALFDGGTFLSKDAHQKYVGTNGYYWSNRIDTDTSNGTYYHYAYCFDIESNNIKSNNSDRRYAGRSIRAVVTNTAIAPLDD